MSTPFDALTNAVTTLISNHKTLQAQHAALQTDIAQRDAAAQTLADQIASTTSQPQVTVAAPAPAPATPYGRHAGDK